MKAQKNMDKQAAGYNRKKRFHRKLFHELLRSRLCDTNMPLIKKKLGNPRALM